MDLGELPNSWAAVTLESVADVHDNLREPVNSTERKKRVGPFPYYGATGQVGWIDDFRQDGEYILLGEDGAPFFDHTKDKAYLVSGKCWVNNHAHVLKGREGVCLNRYLLHALNQVNYRGYANGTTRLKLTQAAMRQLPINLAPLAEQHRIVAKIEELFSELDQGVASLKTAREQLKVYRQSLLKNAFAGKLTVAWRTAHRDQLETAAALQQRIARERQARNQQQLADWQAASQQGPKPKPPKPLPPLTAEELVELPELPEGWGWVKLGSLASQITDGEHFRPTTTEQGIPFLSAKDVRADGVSFDAPLFISLETAEKAWARCHPERNDILIVSRGATVGRMCAVNTDQPFCLLGSVILIKVTPATLPAYLLAALKAPFVNKKIVGASGATAQQAIYLRDIQAVPVAVCSLAEQFEIVQELESKLSEADQLDQTLATALQQADALRQSILKKAFCGQLVKQAKNDEPATALLERIRALRSIDQPVRRGRSAMSQP